MLQHKCDACDGCGRVANDEDQTPWVAWQQLPIQSAIAVALGLVRPITCPRCAGSGWVALDAEPKC